MKPLVFATFLEIIYNIENRKSFISKPELINSLYGYVMKPLGMTGYKVEKTKATYIFQGAPRGSVDEYVREYSIDPKAIENVIRKFKTELVPQLLDVKLKAIRDEFINIIENDKEIPDDVVKIITDLDKANCFDEFLARIFLYSLLPKNKLPNDNKIPKMPKSQKKINRFLPLDKQSREKGPTPVQTKYEEALLEVFGEDTHTEVKEYNQLNEKDKTIFQRHRNDFYAAEFLRTNIRDAYNDNENKYFDVLKSEIYSGIIDTYEDTDYETGNKRLKAVMKAAVIVPVDACWISRETAWIGISQKKGVCHHLVNDGRLDGWVYKK